MTRLFDIQPGDVLTKDVLRKNTVVLRRGTVLTPRLVEKLKHWRIEEVTITGETRDASPEPKAPPAKEPFSEEELFRIKGNFFQGIAGIGNEYRLGFALNDLDTLHWLEALFVSLHEHPAMITLLEKIQAVDDYTYQHSFDTFVLGSLIAAKSGITELQDVAAGFLLHDIGKTKIPSAILDKPRALTSQEMTFVKLHTLYGYQILTDYGFPEEVAMLAQSHHERLDGSGYPWELSALHIPKAVRILSVVDVYSALSLDRPYRPAMPSHQAIEILFEEQHGLELELIKMLCEILEIYPVGATVSLTDKSIAKVVRVDSKIPTFPLLKDAQSKHVFTMPTNRSLKVDTMLQHES
ncbi:HD-GYP domain-containing protein [Marinococcus sp. PL1-022]|uniref:HD-GYP domain-containing protein n=1 Tax=Marinococcus sp. PL1-022 TaxID=3095363 RepID=UPI0029C160FB|nr:HD domain-containing phosphohydrolase [Marinococcus sp. PL1-022]MDX6152625.1 HD domain-containing protein [Marinococcus sp. PL1-022]